VDAKEIPGASRHFFAQVKIVPVSDPRLEIKVRYRTELAPNGDGIAFIRVNNAGQPVPDGVPLGEEEISGPKLSLRWLIFGLAFAAYFAALGIWWFRRSGKKAACVVSLPQKESSP